jgi:CheY-like chemotaxis protein
MTKRVLVVDDEPANLRMLSYVLSHKGYETAAAKDGLEALELLAQSRFDLVISDVRMPRMDGVALARHIVSSQPITPIFLMTAYHFDRRDDISALNIPLLSKPFHLTSCYRKFKRCLEKSGKLNCELVKH